jgi:Nucleotidyltransferase of unknown function (DUF6036)
MKRWNRWSPSSELLKKRKPLRENITGAFRPRNVWRYYSNFARWRSREPMPLPEDWRAFIESLNSHGVEYVVVGAVALAHHGCPRFTGDMDVFVRASAENARRLGKALNELGFGSLGLEAADFENSYRVIQLGVAPNRIDILTSLTGLSFDEAWSDRVEANVEKTPVWFMGRESLILNKRRTGRPQDLADLAALGAGD